MTALIAIAIVATLSQTTAPPAVPGTTPPASPSQVVRPPQAVDALQVQVMLDRSGFSPGAIDGKMGANTRKALELFNSSGMQQPPSLPWERLRTGSYRSRLTESQIPSSKIVIASRRSTFPAE